MFVCIPFPRWHDPDPENKGIFLSTRLEFLPDPGIVIVNLSVFLSSLALEMCVLCSFPRLRFPYRLDPARLSASDWAPQGVAWMAGDLDCMCNTAFSCRM